MKNYTCITLNSLEVPVKLGWTEEERSHEQLISIDVTIQFAEPPKACTTDLLNDTHCYDSLVTAIKTSINDREFRLLEYLGYALYQTIKPHFSPDTLIQIHITKKPAILNLTKGVTFSYGDALQ